MMVNMENREASELSQTVARALRHHQSDNGWTAKHVSRRTGIAYGTVNRKINGKSEIHIDELFVICEAVGTDAHTIIEAAEALMPDGYLRSLLTPGNVSDVPANVTHIHETDWDSYKGAKAADYDAEAETDEPEQP